MVKLKHIAPTLLIIIVTVYIFRGWFPSDEALIKKRFIKLADQVALTPEETQLTATAKANRLRGLFNDQIQIDAPAFDYSRRLEDHEVPVLFLAARANYSRLKLSFKDVDITIETEITATVNLTLIMTGRVRTGDDFEDIQELHCELTKVEDQWLFTAVEFVEVLAK
jgi:hypothetical protein